MNSNLKKYAVLTILFVFPVVIYLFFASGKQFCNLPKLTEKVSDLSNFTTAAEEQITLEDKITILGFWGKGLKQKQSDALNLNEKIYKRFYEFQDFQFVMLLENGQEAAVENLKSALR